MMIAIFPDTPDLSQMSFIRNIIFAIHHQMH